MNILADPTVIITFAFLAFVIQVIFEVGQIWVPLLEGDSNNADSAITRNLNVLQSHPQCGITSGGRDECWWGCTSHEDDLFTVSLYEYEIKTF